MRKKLVSLVLTLIQICIDFNILFAALALIMGLVFVFFLPLTGYAHALFDYHSWWSFVLQVLWLAGMALLTLIMWLGIRNLLSNINDGLYFVDQNMVAVRQILWTTAALFIMQSISTAVFSFYGIRDKLHLLTFQGNDLSDNLFFLVIFFLIYLIFKRGIALQKDADEII